MQDFPLTNIHLPNLESLSLDEVALQSSDSLVLLLLSHARTLKSLELQSLALWLSEKDHLAWPKLFKKVRGLVLEGNIVLERLSLTGEFVTIIKNSDHEQSFNYFKVQEWAPMTNDEGLKRFMCYDNRRYRNRRCEQDGSLSPRSDLGQNVQNFVLGVTGQCMWMSRIPNTRMWPSRWSGANIFACGYSSILMKDDWRHGCWTSNSDINWIIALVSDVFSSLNGCWKVPKPLVVYCDVESDQRWNNQIMRYSLASC